MPHFPLHLYPLHNIPHTRKDGLAPSFFSFSKNAQEPPRTLESPTDPYTQHRQAKNQLLIEHFQLNETQLQQANHNHQRNGIHFSASYSGDWLLLGFAEKKLGVDIEVLKPRNSSLLEKYRQELEKYQASLANSNNLETANNANTERAAFYRLWTGKEAILKASDSKNLDLIDQISFLFAESITSHHKPELTQTKKEKPDGSIQVSFDQVLAFQFQGRRWQVRSFRHENVVGAVSQPAQ